MPDLNSKSPVLLLRKVWQTITYIQSKARSNGNYPCLYIMFLSLGLDISLNYYGRL
jgi:hypothetical protein